jgi:deoxyribose-phosphate aldolase
MVANTGLLKDGNIEKYGEDIFSVAVAVADFNLSHGCQRGLKVIIETCGLNEEEVETATRLVREVGFQQRIPVFVKTSTGYGNEGATVENLVKIRKALGEYDQVENPVGIKAAGGIRTALDAVRMLIAAGVFDENLKPVHCHPDAVRIGTSSTASILNEFEKLVCH